MQVILSCPILASEVGFAPAPSDRGEQSSGLLKDLFSRSHATLHQHLPLTPPTLLTNEIPGSKYGNGERDVLVYAPICSLKYNISPASLRLNR